MVSGAEDAFRKTQPNPKISATLGETAVRSRMRMRRRCDRRRLGIIQALLRYWGMLMSLMSLFSFFFFFLFFFISLHVAVSASLRLANSVHADLFFSFFFFRS
jgi:hypothetical protein